MREVPLKFLIVDDHALVRKGIIAVLGHHNPNWILHEADDGVKAILMAQKIDPDFILLDYHLPLLNGGKVASIIKKASPRAKIIMVSMDLSPEMVIEMVEAGVSGIVSKQSHEHEILEAIDTVNNGKKHLSSHAKKIIPEEMLENRKFQRPSRHKKNVILTNREMEVLVYVVQGLKCREIAAELALSARTVANHKTNMFRKCGVNSTNELTRFALKSGFISLSGIHHVAARIQPVSRSDKN